MMPASERQTPGTTVDEPSDLGLLFHRLNNQLGVILANSELLETKLTEESHRVRAAQVVTGALEAIGIVQHLKQAVGTAPADPIRHGR